MKNLIATLLAPLSLLACTSPAPGDPDPAGNPDTVQAGTGTRQAALQRARARLEAGELDEALAITDELLADNADDRPALLLATDANVRLFQSGRSGAQYLLADAVSNLQRALNVDANDPERWIQLADLCLRSSAFDRGRDAGLKAASLMKEAGAAPADVCRAALAAADNEMQMFVDARRPELGGDGAVSAETQALADTVLGRLAFVQGGLPGPAHHRMGQVHQWLGQDLQALQEYERGIQNAPGHQPLHQAFQGLYYAMDKRAECVASYRRMLRDTPGQRLLVWFCGRAQVELADYQRRNGQTDTSQRTYGDAVETFGQYRAMRPDHATNTDHMIAVCRLSQGRIALEGGDLDMAQRRYKEAYEASSRVADSNNEGVPLIADSFGGTYVSGLHLIGVALVEPSTRPALAAGLRYFDAMLARHPDRWGFLYNAAGLTARDLGSATERSARASEIDDAEKTRRVERAKQLYEQSYAHYCKAIELEPNDERYVNDCGLMLLYHLHRDYDRARDLFDRAIVLGQPKIDALEDDASPERRNDLEEAVGDAYQNTAVLMRAQGKEFAEYESLLQKAVTYYPYQRRNAAMMLRTRGQGTRRGAGGGQARRAPQDPRHPQFERARAAADVKVKENDLDGALLILDEQTEVLKDYAPYHLLVGSLTAQYAEQSRVGSNRSSLLWADAVQHLEKAVELDSDPVRPRLELARAYYNGGDLAAAAKTAQGLLSHIRSDGGSSPQWTEAAHRVRAEASTRLFINGKRTGAAAAGDAIDEHLRQARASFVGLEKAGSLDDTLVTTWANLEQWAGSNDRALEVLRDGLTRKPSSGTMLTSFVDTASRLGVSQQAVDALAARTDAIGLWYLGKARFLRGVELASANQPDTALTLLDQAVAAFDASKGQNAGYAASADQWIVSCLGKKGNVLAGLGKWDDAERILLDAAQRDSSQITTPLGGPDTIRRGIMVVADHYYRGGDLGRTERIYRAAARAAPWDTDLTNNHGLFARDHGAQLEQQGKTGEARALFEASYASYTRASENAPDNIRFQNDRALLLIYHLKRDWKLSHDLLRDAIERGTARLADDPPADAAALRELQESVGDCHQNLGYWQEKHAGDLKKARASYRKSLEFHPFAQVRASAAHLRRVERALGVGGRGK